MMERTGMRRGESHEEEARENEREVGVLSRVCKDHPSLPLLHGVVPDLERTKGVVVMGATVYLQSMS